MSKKRKRKLPAWTHHPLYWGLRAGIELLETAGIEEAGPFMHALGGRFGSLPSNKKRLQRAIDNIRWCFPELEEDAARELAIDAYRNLFGVACEMAIAPNLLTPDNWQQYLDFRNYDDAIAKLASDRPVILITGHCGNWELLGSAVSMVGYPMHALYRPLDMKPLNNWVYRTRAKHGIVLVDKFGATDTMPALMQERKPVAFIADQNAGVKGLFVPFFDRLASAYKSIGLLAMQHDAWIVCGSAFRTGDTRTESAGQCAPYFRYELQPTDIFGPEDWADQPDPLFYITARYRKAIEDMVRTNPSQYLWMHRYWKSRPRHEVLSKPFPKKLREKIEQLPWSTQESVDRVVARSAQDAAAIAHNNM